MDFIFISPSVDDLTRLLRAWRFWLLGALLGAVLGSAVYSVFPPPYRARATVNVDFNLEQAWPQDTDRQQFFYLERETRKLVELAWADDVVSGLSSEFGVPVDDLRDQKLLLAQPAEAGWHFYADDRSAALAADLSARWAQLFVERLRSGVEDGTVNEWIQAEVTQSPKTPAARRVPMSAYMLAGAFAFLTAAVFVVLFIRPKPS